MRGQANHMWFRGPAGTVIKSATFSGHDLKTACFNRAVRPDKRKTGNAWASV